MASGGSDVDVENQNLAAVCSICLRNFSTPRYLPCSHTFCHDCLSEHIKLSCDENDSPLGFLCPLCRVFIPEPGGFGECPPNAWVELFPENKFMSNVVLKYGDLTGVLCGPCNVDNVETEGSYWCRDCTEALCKDCFKFHKRFQALRGHEITTLRDASATLPPSHIDMDMCRKHGNRKMEVFCENHQTLCCILCLSFQHRGCKTVNLIEKISKKCKKEKSYPLEAEIAKLCKRLDETIMAEKSNIANIEELTERYEGDIRKAKADMVTLLDKLEEKHLNELTKLSKQAKEKLEKSIKSFENRVSYLKHWKNLLQQRKEGQHTQTEFALVFFKLKEILVDMRRMKITKTSFLLQGDMCKLFKKMTTLNAYFDVNLTEDTTEIMADINLKKAKLKLFKKITIPRSDTATGIFLTEELMLFADRKQQRCIVCDEDGSIIQEVKLPGTPWQMCMDSTGKILVTIPRKKTIQVLHFENLTLIQGEEIKLRNRCRGIAAYDDTIIVATRQSLVYYNTSFDFLTDNPLDLSYNTDEVAVDKNGNVIFCSNPVNHGHSTVTKLDQDEELVFTHSSQNSSYFNSVSVDQGGNVYVVDSGNESIVFLSEKGTVIRTLEGLKDPVWVTCLRDGFKFCVGEAGGNVKLYEFIGSV